VSRKKTVSGPGGQWHFKFVFRFILLIVLLIIIVLSKITIMIKIMKQAGYFVQALTYKFHRRALAMGRKGEVLYSWTNFFKISFAFSGWLSIL